jgi:hypothetical protein
MSTPSYISNNPDELFENASEEIQDLIGSGEVNSTTAILSNNYKIPEASQTALSNIISFVLIGALQPEDVVQALQDLVNVSPEDAIKIATDLEHSILEKARISLFKKSDTPVTTLEFQGDKSKAELRKEILDTTKRESALIKAPTDPNAKKPIPIVIKPGSRTQLLEQLQVLGTIPDDDEIETRLTHIQEQIAALKKQEEDNSLDSNIALKSFMFGEQGKTVANPNIIKATFSVPPTRYNVDPYREGDKV